MNRFAKQILPFSSLLFIISLWTFLEPDKFLTAQNFINVLRRSSVNGIIASGMTFIIISAGIDLSVGSMLAMCGMAGSFLMLYLGGGSWAEISSGSYIALSVAVMLAGTLGGIAAGAICGYLNGFLTTKLKLAPVIVTLGTMSIFRGISYIANDGKPFATADYSYLDVGTIGKIPVSVLILALVMLFCGYLLKHTPFGRYTYAIGANEKTAFYSGINVNRIKLLIYMLTGALTGLAAMIGTSRASSAQPSAGISLELDVIAAVIIGGASPSGGRGSMTGTLVGVLLINFLRNGLTLLNISTNVQLVVIGLIIITAVAADQLATARKE